MQRPAPKTSRLPFDVLRHLVAGLVLALGMVQIGFAAEAYKLGVSDKITVRVVEWQAADASFQDWTAVSGEYLVGPDGSVSFPFVGDVAAAGKSTAELGKVLGEALRATLGLTDPPDVAVQVTAFGPIYVAGDVRSPGAYSFAPGLNVVKALSLAGGMQKAADPAARNDRDLINLQGGYDVLRDEHVRLLVHRARLDAVLAKQDAITLPAQMSDDAKTQALVAIETAVLKAGAEQVVTQVAALSDQKQLLTKGLDTLEQKRQTTSDQLSAAQDRLKKVQALADNGLAITDRVVSLQTSVAELEGRLLDIDAAELKAKQDVGTADNQSAKILSDQFIQTSEDRQDTDSKLAEVELKMATQERLIREAAAFGGTPVDQSTSFTYTILREGKEMVATNTDSLQPGDVVTATLTINP